MVSTSGLDMAIEAFQLPLAPSLVTITSSSAIAATASCTSIVTINYCKRPSFQESSWAIAIIVIAS